MISIILTPFSSEIAENANIIIKIKSVFEKKVEDKTAEENIKLEQVKIDEAFSTEINKICSKIGKRLQAWGIEQYSNVQFDMADFDFKFGGTSRYLLWFNHIVLFIVNIFLLKVSVLYLIAFFAQMIVYVLAITKKVFKINNKLFNFCSYYCMTVLAQAIGVYKTLTGQNKPFWEKAESTR